MTTTPHYSDDAVTLFAGDCIEVMRSLPDASVDAVVTDPPYGLEFMGKEWDRIGDIGKASHQGFTDGTGFKGFRLPTGYNASANLKCLTCGRWRFDHVGRRCECGPKAVWPNVRAQQGRAMQEWHEEWAAEALRVLKPGGHLAAFGGTRTWHRLACAIEDAGFEIRDALAWMCGSGFPKSLDVSKAIDKAAGAEREVVGTRTTDIGTGGGSTPYIGDSDNRGITAPATDAARQWDGWGTALKPAYEPIVLARKPLTGTVAANVLEHGTGALNIDGCRVGSDGGTAGAGIGPKGDVYGDGLNGDFGQPIPGLGRWPANVVLDADAAAMLDAQSGYLHGSGNKSDTATGVDSTYAASGYHVSYAGRAGRDYGSAGGGASRFFYTAKADQNERPKVNGVAHPTVKPLDLMRWLVRLVTPPGGTVLEPFAGSGTTAEACVIEGFQCVAIEREPDYLPLIVARLSKPIERTLL